MTIRDIDIGDMFTYDSCGELYVKTERSYKMSDGIVITNSVCLHPKELRGKLFDFPRDIQIERLEQFR